MGSGSGRFATMSEWELDLLLLIGIQFMNLRDIDMELDMLGPDRISAHGKSASGPTGSGVNLCGGSTRA